MSRRPKDFDLDLRERFQALRRAEGGSAPAFDPARRPAKESATARRHGSRLRGRLAWGTVTLLAIAVVTTLALWKRTPEGPTVEEAIALSRELQAWTAPTDALLLTSDLSIPGGTGNPPSTSPVRSDGTATQPSNRPE